MQASRNDALREVKCLVQAGATLDLKQHKDGWTALMYGTFIFIYYCTYVLYAYAVSYYLILSVCYALHTAIIDLLPACLHPHNS